MVVIRSIEPQDLMSLSFVPTTLEQPINAKQANTRKQTKAYSYREREESIEGCDFEV